MKWIIFILFFSLQLNSFSQKILEIDRVRFNKFKPIQLFNESFLEYKLKGEHSYRIKKMVNMTDSLIIFSDDSKINISQIKAIKLRDANHLFPLLSGFFYTGGVMFIALDSFNNAINQESVIVKPGVVAISAGLIAAGFLIKQMSIKHIRINKHNSLRILDIDYQHINK